MKERTCGDVNGVYVRAKIGQLDNGWKIRGKYRACHMKNCKVAQRGKPYC